MNQKTLTISSISIGQQVLAGGLRAKTECIFLGFQEWMGGREFKNLDEVFKTYQVSNLFELEKQTCTDTNWVDAFFMDRKTGSVWRAWLHDGAFRFSMCGDMLMLSAS